MRILNTNSQLTQIDSAAQYGQLQPDAGLSIFDPHHLDSHRPDTHLAIVDQDRLLARCSLWWQEVPSIAGGEAGLIGHYAAIDDSVASELLAAACHRLAVEGCTVAIGPMDQNTWRDYRFVIDEGDRPRFFLEPETNPRGCAQFRAYGFDEIAWYSSALVTDLTMCSPQVARAGKRLEEKGIRIRPLDQDQIELELRRIFAVVQVAFRENPYYVPVSESDFLAMYRPFQHTISSDLILLAEDCERVIGFVFAVPDLLQAARGESVESVVVKTFGVLPGHRYAGLGQVLLETVHHRAAAAGFRSAIHALVRDVAHMNRIVDRYGDPFRQYALFGKELC